jgi:pimeloyl-ACP methyl ester carboxylesterase
MEYTPLKLHNKGPGQADGVIYFVEGLDKNDRSRDDFRATYPIVYQKNQRFGWDVVEAKFPNNADHGISSIAQSSNHVIARLAQLRGEGYKKIVLAGQSWGAWVSIDVAARRTADKPMDSLLLIAPANYGMKQYGGKPNEFFVLNKTE